MIARAYDANEILKGILVSKQAPPPPQISDDAVHEVFFRDPSIPKKDPQGTPRCNNHLDVNTLRRNELTPVIHNAINVTSIVKTLVGSPSIGVNRCSGSNMLLNKQKE